MSSQLLFNWILVHETWPLHNTPSLLFKKKNWSQYIAQASLIHAGTIGMCQHCRLGSFLLYQYEVPMIWTLRAF